MMKGKSISDLGGICSILVGIFYLLGGIAYLLLPPAQKATGDPAAFLSSFAENNTMSTLNYWSFGLTGLLGIAVVLALADKIISVSEGWGRWTSNLAVVGFAFLALNYFRSVSIYPDRAAAFVAGDEVTKAAIAANQSLVGVDPQGWVTYGLVGIWFLVVNLLALRGDLWSKLLSYVGIVGAIAYGMVVAGLASQTEILVTIAAGAAVIIAPIWYIWMGLDLRRSNS
jgi:hypothetical protein